MIIFFIVALLVLSIIHGVVGWRIIPALGLSGSVKLLIWEEFVPISIKLMHFFEWQFATVGVAAPTKLKFIPE